ncbi:hypothetical protein SAMN04488498_101224 [Mesorhizobium albiziae]|uniref:Uncharacterized protein n=1 Tax=Neomesorhizobium albiziae TaxID=335020 RepID=A0A1I3V6M9_9HYPH|nr:hypothetical protein [Mesorhizobium albiziae]GLS28681.1 hypothetical protein GCM10007937_03880 [Mesorhizobium albiziae]SFJ90802.1 hypothetical protein SAMN04488498_101224 [Mesorhizobium albiziae]
MLLGGLGARLALTVSTTGQPAASTEGENRSQPQQAPATTEDAARSRYVYVPSRTAPQPADRADDIASDLETPAQTMKNDVAEARRTALSALNNERFRLVLEQVSGAGSSDAVMMMRRDPQSAGTDFKSARSLYAENSE